LSFAFAVNIPDVGAGVIPTSAETLPPPGCEVAHRPNRDIANRKGYPMKFDSKKLRAVVVGAAFGGSLLCTAGLGVAAAEPEPDPAGDGLVTVMQGETAVAEAVSPDEAVTTVTQICGVADPDATNMAKLVDVDGVSHTACTGLPDGDVTVVQNAASSEEEAPPPPDVGQDGSPAADESIGSTWDPI
jgi:hypothetical protein